MNLRGVDLNLLVAFEALVTERHVSKAAERIALSQPAMSNALSRLRHLLDDPVLVRTTRGMEPTPRALELLGPVSQALRQIERSLSARARFDAATANRNFVLGATDYMECTVLPQLINRISAQAPGIGIHVHSRENSIPHRELENGDIDLALGHYRGIPKRLKSRLLFTEHLVCVVRKNHPRVTEPFTLDQFTALPHLLVATPGQTLGAADAALSAIGRSRRIMLVVPHFLVAPLIIARSDLAATLTSRIAHKFARMLPLNVLAPPLKLPEFDISMIWHPRNERDPAHVWLREMLGESCKTL